MAKMKLEVGDNFYKDGKEVTVVKIGNIIIEDKEYDGVVYEYQDGQQFGNTFIEKKFDFTSSVIPTTLRNGDRIVATCMGKILATYKVDGHGYETADAISESGDKMQFMMKIKPNGFVEPHYLVESLPKQTEFLLVTPKLEKKLVIRKFINSCLSKIGNIQKTISSDKIDYLHTDTTELQNLTLSVDNLKKEVDKTLKFLNNE